MRAHRRLYLQTSGHGIPQLIQILFLLNSLRRIRIPRAWIWVEHGPKSKEGIARLGVLIEDLDRKGPSQLILRAGDRFTFKDGRWKRVS